MFKINLRGQTFLYNLLVNSKLRVWRHVLFVVALAAISFNQTYVIFQQDVTELGTALYWITLCNLASYLVVAYLNIYLLIPRYLMRKKYLLYTLALFVIVFVLNTKKKATASAAGEETVTEAKDDENTADENEADNGEKKD